MNSPGPPLPGPGVLSAKAEKAYANKHSEAVTNALHHVKDFMTDSQKAHTMLKEGKILMEQGNYQGAIECYNEGINFQPIVPLFTNRATCHRNWSMFAEAYFDYSFAIRMEPENGALYCLRGVVLVKMKKVSMALDDVDLGCKMDPAAANLFCRASVHADIGNHDIAIRDLSKAISEESCTLELRLRCLYRRASSFFENSNYGECINDLKEVLKSDPNSIPPRVLLGSALKMTAELKSAEENLTHAIGLDSKSAALYMERGDIRYRTGLNRKIVESILDFNSAVRLLEEKPKVSNPTPPGANGSSHGGRKASRIASSGSDSARSETSLTSITNIKDGKITKKLLIPGGRGSGQNSARSDGPPISSRKNVESVFEIQTNNERREQLGEALHRRAQSKLLLEETDLHDNVADALDDAKRALVFSPVDDDYQLVVAVCYIRHGNFAGAMEELKVILDRAPNNEKALFHIAACQRQGGRLKDSISNLSKIIAFHDETKKASVFPLFCIYEARGAIFHQLKAYSYALSDFGRSVAMNPDRAQNYYLRADCHSKLGNYELAIQDFNAAERLKFHDIVSLLISRGLLYRLLGSSRAAFGDLETALRVIKEKKGGVQEAIRIQLLCALCLVDLKEYDEAHYILTRALTLLSGESLCYTPIMNASDDDGPLVPVQEQSVNSEEGTLFVQLSPLMAPNSLFSPEHSVPFSAMGSVQKKNRLPSLIAAQLAGESLLDDDWQKECNYTAGNSLPEKQAKQLEWTLRYHVALSLYMMHDYTGAGESLKLCTTELASYCPDTDAFGITLFFLGICHTVLSQWAEAENVLNECLKSSWGVASAHNLALIYFTRGKQFQCTKRHKEAIADFTMAIEQEPENAYAIFRRAWSYKATDQFILAGNDFETSKGMKKDDPNFAVDYKKISNFEFMEIESEPDITEVFPPLLPVPGAI